MMRECLAAYEVFVRVPPVDRRNIVRSGKVNF